MATPALLPVFSSDWDFRTASGPQPNGKFGTSSGSWTGVIFLSISGLDRNNADASNAIKAVAAGDSISAQLRNNPTNCNATWTANAPATLASDGNYYTIPVSSGTSVGTPAAAGIFTLTYTTASLPFPPPESSLYWVLTATDLTKLQANADKLILQGFAPTGAINLSGSTTITYTQAFWRSNSVPPFIQRVRPTT